MKEKISAANNLDKEPLEKVAMDNEKVRALLNGKTVVKVVAVPNKLINIVVK